MTRPIQMSTRVQRRKLPLSSYVFLSVVLIGVVGPLLMPYGPNEIGVGTPLDPPSGGHLFGTDQFGRDVFTRVVAGTRISVGIGLGATLIALAVGSLLGALSASGPKPLDEIIMRALDTLMAFPGLLLAIVLAAVFGAGWATTLVVLGIIYTPAFARLVRASLKGELTQDYVTAARILGSSRKRILIHHVGRNVFLPVLVFATVILADAVVLEAALSFIGVGTRPPAPSWGNVVADGRSLILSGVWWVSAFGGLAIFVTVFALNRSADALGLRADIR